MAIDIKFDLIGNPEPPTIILANRNGNKLGKLDIDIESISLSDKFNDVSEFSFTVHRDKLVSSKSRNNTSKSANNYLLEDSDGYSYFYEDVVGNNYLLEDSIKTKEEFRAFLWNNIVNFKLVYCKEWDMWFEITVEIDEKNETIKTVFCTQLGQAELSQIKLYDVEINTEKDIERDDYKISILYDENDPKSSILNRMLEKAPHYSIAYVDQTIAKIQRSFSFDDTSICDGFQEISEEIGCLFKYPSKSNENGKIRREIYVYDLQQNCNDCGHRGEFSDICPKCGSTNIKYGYGDDTLIFVTSDELASNGIQLTTDTDSVKNCFKLEAGDDLMTATVRNCNPNGTDYIWRFSEDIKEDMSNELIEKLKSYDEVYQYYSNEYISEIDSELLSNYNALVNKYIENNGSLKTISNPIQGYSSLMNAYYNTIDLSLFLKSVLTPFYHTYLTDESDIFLTDELENFLMYKQSAKTAQQSAEEQAGLLTSNALSPVSVTNINVASLATINSTVLAMARIIVSSTYKVEVNASEMFDNGDTKTWTGNFIITSYSDEEDTAVSEVVSIIVNDDYENFVKQKMERVLSKENADDLSITGLFAKGYTDFCEDLKQYALNPLISFRDACQACIDILIEQGIGNDTTWSDTTEGAEGNLYENLYTPYYNKLMAIEAEIKVRENEINSILGVYNSDGVLISEGVQGSIEKCKNKIQEALDFEKYLGAELWLEFCAYRREDKYSNHNYISDGLDNAELFKKAHEFFEVAKNEIYKSSELQHSISTTLNNLLAIPKFKPLVKHFKVGNWIRVQIDNRIYKLRLLEYGIDYGDFNNVPVEFSDVTKIKNGITDVKDILSQTSSMASSYGSVKRQASQGEKSNAVVNSWVDNGLNATNTKIVGTNNQNQVWDKNGILCRQYDPITETYGDEQLKIINSTIAITDDNWETTKTAIGRYYYIDPTTKELKSTYGVNGETIVGKLLIGEKLDITNDNGSLQFGNNGFVVENDVNTISMNPNSESIFNISNDSKNIFSLNEKGELVIVGNITASSLTLLNDTTIETGNITGLSDVAISGSYNDLEDVPTKLSQFENDREFVANDANNLTNYYNKNETNILLDSKINISDLATVATSGSYNDLVDIEEFKEWILEQIQLAIGQ